MEKTCAKGWYPSPLEISILKQLVEENLTYHEAKTILNNVRDLLDYTKLSTESFVDLLQPMKNSIENTGGAICGE